jgi:hypothetical protein
MTSPAAALLAQRGGNDAAGAGGMLCMCAVPLLIIGGTLLVVFLIMWKVYTKAGRPGWEAIVPIYNSWILVTEICKLEPLWFFLQFVPIANIISAWKVSQELAKKFGKSDAFGIGLFLLAPIFLAMLAFGDARYQGGRSKGRSLDDDEDDEDEEDDRPRRSSRRDDDEDEDDDRPRRGGGRRRDDD